MVRASCVSPRTALPRTHPGSLCLIRTGTASQSNLHWLWVTPGCSQVMAGRPPQWRTALDRWENEGGHLSCGQEDCGLQSPSVSLWTLTTKDAGLASLSPREQRSSNIIAAEESWVSFLFFLVGVKPQKELYSEAIPYLCTNTEAVPDAAFACPESKSSRWLSGTRCINFIILYYVGVCRVHRTYIHRS